jgi:hypothetical protein
MYALRANNNKHLENVICFCLTNINKTTNSEAKNVQIIFIINYTKTILVVPTLSRRSLA